MSHLLRLLLCSFFAFSYSLVPLENPEGKEEVVKFRSIQYFVMLYLQSEKITFSTWFQCFYLHK